MGLWNSKAISRIEGLEEIPEEDLGRNCVEAFKKFEEKKKNCLHPCVQRWGPLISFLPYGGVRVDDSYSCLDCGYHSETPIGPYAKEELN